jgi:hypothetical protein
MTIADTNTADARLFRTLNGIPEVDMGANLRVALAAGGRVTAILREIIALRRGAGRLTPQEYFLCRSRHKTYYLDQRIMPRTVAET